MLIQLTNDTGNVVLVNEEHIKDVTVSGDGGSRITYVLGGERLVKNTPQEIEQIAVVTALRRRG